jgi:putative transcriptional regulator
LAEKIAGEITLSQNPGETLRKWRRNFAITQTDLSNYMGMSPSVISDYESGRRKSPGIMIVSKIIDALLRIDEGRGCNVLRAYEDMWGDILGIDSICSVCEYQDPIPLREVAKKLEAKIIFGRTDITIWGYTVIDSIKAIIDMLPDHFQKIYGRSTASPDIHRSAFRQIAHGGGAGEQPQAGCGDTAGNPARPGRPHSHKDRRGREHSSFDDTFFR